MRDYLAKLIQPFINATAPALLCGLVAASVCGRSFSAVADVDARLLAPRAGRVVMRSSVAARRRELVLWTAAEHVEPLPAAAALVVGFRFRRFRRHGARPNSGTALSAFFVHLLRRLVSAHVTLILRRAPTSLGMFSWIRRPRPNWPWYVLARGKPA